MNRYSAGFLLVTSLAFSQGKLEFAPYSKNAPANYTSVVTLKNGARLFVGSSVQRSAVTNYNRTAMSLTAIGVDGNPYGIGPLSAFGGNGDDVPVDAAVDGAGNVWIIGSTSSDDFKLVNPIVSNKTPYQTVPFVLEFNPTLDTLLFASYLGNTTVAASLITTSTSAITVDASGNAYVGGMTNDPAFPTTPGAFNTTPPPGPNSGSSGNSFPT